MTDSHFTEEESDSLLETLKRITLFAQLEEAELLSLSKTGRAALFQPGETLMRESDPGDVAYVLLEGRVAVSQGGTEVVYRGPGDCIGELALLDSSPRSATVTAVERVRAVALHRQHFSELLVVPGFVKSLLHALCAKVRQGDVEVRAASQHLRQLMTLKEDLFQLILHDLRNPLNNLLAAIGLLKMMQQDYPNDERLARFLAAAGISGQYMGRLLEEVLEVCRLEDAEFKANLEVSDLRLIGQQTVTYLSELAAARRIVIDVLDGPPCLAMVDPRLLRRALENFLSNALRCSESGSTVQLAFEAGPQWCSIDVADRGPGIAPEYREAVFRKFGTLEMKSDAPRRGFGLGLHLATLVARVHGGSVSIHDNPGGGAIFRLRVPAAHSS